MVEKRAIGVVLLFVLAGCGSDDPPLLPSQTPGLSECADDDDCSDDQVCERGRCVADDDSSGFAGRGGRGGSGSAGRDDAGSHAGAGRDADAGTIGGAGSGSAGNSAAGSGSAGNGSAGTDSAGTGGSTDPGGAGSGPVDCSAAMPVFPAFDRSCQADADCAMGFRKLNCCGTMIFTGFRAEHAAAFESAAERCDAQFPLCRCALQSATADDGTIDRGLDSSFPLVRCVAGQCTTTFNSPNVTTICGASGLTCTTASEICVESGPIGPAYQYTCRPLPLGCQGTRRCACLGELCSAGDACFDRGNNTVTCECTACQ